MKSYIELSNILKKGSHMSLQSEKFIGVLTISQTRLTIRPENISPAHAGLFLLKCY